MIIYQNTIKGFKFEVEENLIADSVERDFEEKFGRKVSQSEKSSWQNSLSFMERVVRRSAVADDCGVLIEYNLPTSSSRIDFIITGHDANSRKNFVIIELKQWQTASETHKDGVVLTYLGHDERETPHPSYQAYSYKSFLQDYNQNIYEGEISPFSCAYLHNYKQLDPEPLMAEIYQTYVLDSPIYFQEDCQKLADFLKQHVGQGKGMGILYEIESGKIRPSKKLIEHVSKMFKGNQEFVLIDTQKVAYETALDIAKNSQVKTIVIIKGGPGTGKSVISMNLLGGLLKQGLNSIFIAPNASFRDVMVQKLAQDVTKKRLHHLFKGSSGFFEVPLNTYDVAVVDEAHRLKNQKAYQYRGFNQIEDIVQAAKVSIFFVDENQMIRPDDIGSIVEIKRVGQDFNADVHVMELTTQFRCSGAEGYINWLDDIFHLKETANFDGWEDGNFDFKIFDNPNELRTSIQEKQSQGFSSRIVAGYAWKWSSPKEGNPDGEVQDVDISEFDFKMPWNSRKVGTTWAIDEEGVNQVGCIHTCQGLEFDYVGVIVGRDLRFNADKLEYYVDWASYKDSSGKKGLKNDPEKLTLLVKNIYKTLMTRGIKGCYVFFQDSEVKKYVESRLKTRAV